MKLPGNTTLYNFPHVSGYTLVEQLYLGSRTAVYRAVETATQHSVVIKLLRENYPGFSDLVQFRSQYAITKNLPIPGIIRPLSLELLNSGYALVMEDWGGVALSGYIQQQALSFVEVLAIAIQLTDILHDLSRHQVVHKDVKPANILIHPESRQIKLIDFSIASLLPKETQEIQSPNVLEGTLAYLAPEQTGRMNRGIDYRSDFYALGVTLHQLLTGSLPFQSDDPLELVHCHIAKTAVPVDQVNPEVPSMVAAIVAKLMAKNAEDRYQNAMGLKHDLQHCLSQWKETGAIASFRLGQRDVSDRFLIPEKLYGRQAEVQTLLDAFDRVAAGSSELMLVAGFSGIGKTAVVNEVHKPIVRQRGYFVKGKYDQFNRNIPLSAFVQALRDLMGQLLAESDAQLHQWKTQILEVLGGNGQVLIEVIPELEQVIGKQMPAPELSGSAAQNRFNLLFQKFIEVFTTLDHPLVMFLDDLQWADTASLQLIKLLMNDNGYLLMLGAYRDNEVSPTHPFMMTIDELRKTHVVVNTITLVPLALADTNHLVADTLNCSRQLAQPLTELIVRKTKGNPFFTTQFLKALYEDGLITFNRDCCYWECDIAEVKARSLTDDVVEFMALQLQKLPEETQQVLKLAACVGNQFDLNTLAIVSEQSPNEVAAILWKVLQEGLVLPTTQVYKLFQSTDQPNPENTINPSYRFLHDRVQQAAYSLISAHQKQATHLKIGQLLLQNTCSDQDDEQIFAIVNQFNLGIDLVSNSQRQEVAQLNLRASRKARTATAYRSALTYATTGISLLSPTCWQTQYDLTLALYQVAAETAYLDGDFEQMEQASEQVLQQARTPLDKVSVYEFKIEASIAQNSHIVAIADGLEILHQLGIDVPSTPTQSDIQAAFQETALAIGNRTPAELLELSAMQEACYLAALRIMMTVVPATFIAQPTLFPPIALKPVYLSATYGNAAISPFAYALYALLLFSSDDIDRAYQFGQLALHLSEQFPEPHFKPRTSYMVYTFSLHWKEHLQRSLQPLKTAYLAGLDVGDLSYTGYAAYQYSCYAYHAGQPLLELAEEIANANKVLDKINQKIMFVWNSIHLQTIFNLLGETKEPTQLIGKVCDEHVQIPLLQASNDRLGLSEMWISKLILSYLFANYASAVDCAAQALSYLGASAAKVPTVIFHFYDSLAQLAVYLDAPQEQQREIMNRVVGNQAKLQNWSQHAPMNHLHKFDLVKAEQYRVLGQQLEAMEAYDRAIAGAKANGYIQEEALANELAAKFYLAWGKEKVAAGYMQEAYYAYTRWGAKAKIDDLAVRHPSLLRPILETRQGFNALETLATIAAPHFSIHASTGASHLSSSSSINDTFDFAAILRASQSLSSTIQLDDLLHQLTQIILQNSGADRCALILPNAEAEWEVRALACLREASIATPTDTQLCYTPLQDNPDVPTKLIYYVRNTQEAVMIDDCETDLPVSGEYLSRHRPKSVLCLPILNQGNLIGILYLQNQLTRGVFTSDRILILNFLCAQAAISLENARLYNQEQQKTEEIAQKEAEYRGIFESVNDGLSICDLEIGQVVAVNSALCQMYDYTPEEFAQLTAVDFMHPDYLHLFNDFLEVLKSGQPFCAEGLVRRKDGSFFAVESKAVPFFYKGKPHGLTMTRDISDRKAAEALVQQKNQALEQALIQVQQSQAQVVQSEKMSALGNLVAGVAHEINNPIGFLNGSINNAKDYVQDLLDYLSLYQQHHPQAAIPVQDKAEDIDLEFLREDLPKLLDAMQGATDRIRDISNSLRTFSRADTEYKVSANLHEGLDSTLLILKYRLKANEFRPAIAVIQNYGEIPPIDCFPGQLNQVFMNIVANAIDMFDEVAQQSSFEALKDTSQQIMIQTALTNDAVEIRIQDNGKGMTEEVQARIFDHLFTTKGVGKGTGLGLAIARQIVEEKHEGTIEVDSALGTGTAFIITLPISKL